MSRRTLIIGLAALVVIVAVGVGGLIAIGGGESSLVVGTVDTDTDAEPAAVTVEASGDLSTCAGLVRDEGRECYAAELDKIVNDASDPLAAVEGITQAAYADQTGFLLSNCHGIMHTVARKYALRTGLKLADLMDSLPRTNDPGCSAGYAHGLVTAVAPEIEASGPEVANQLCAGSETRYQRYSCTHGFGHAFMRLNNDVIAPSLEMCEQLGADAAPDCAQGIYHDYWFAVNGTDELAALEDPVTDPRELCGSQPEEFVRPCWYRAFVETAQGQRTESPEQVEAFCAGLTGLQRASCVTGSMVVGPPDPRNQLIICSELSADSDIEACIRGTKVQNLIQFPDDMKVDLIKDCKLFDKAMALKCYRWLGKTLGVLTDGKLLEFGCPELPEGAPRKACEAGVESMDGPLVTFS